MARGKPARHAVRNGPVRSGSAARAHAAGEVSWVIDLAQSPAELPRRSPLQGPAAVTGFVAVASALWLFDLGYLLTHLHP